MVPTVHEKDVEAPKKDAELLSEKVSDDSIVSEPAPVYQPDPSTSDSSKDKPVNIDEKHDSTTTKKTSPTLEEAQKHCTQQTKCVFGLLNSFFFCYGGDGNSNWVYDAPQNVSVNTVQDWQISQPYEVALSPYGAGYFAFQSQGRLAWHYINICPSARPKKRKLRKKFDAVVEAYAKLKVWLRDNVITADDIKSTKVVFGPAARYMAWKSNGTWISNDLPISLVTELRNRKEGAKVDHLPRHITFGIGNAWAAIWKDDSNTIELDGKFANLAQLVKERSKASIDFIALSCCDDLEEYFIGFSSCEHRYRMTARRRRIVKEAWDNMVKSWCSKFDTTLVCNSIDGNNESRTIHDPTCAVEVDLSKAKAEQIKESERLANQAALLSIKSSEKSIKASRVAIAGGVVAIAAGCTVM